MKKAYSISIYHDKRRAKADGSFPVKLRVYDAFTKKTKLFETQFSFTEKNYKSIWLSKKTRAEFREQRLKLQALENHAHQVADSLRVFSIEEFEAKIFKKKGAGKNISYYYEKVINENKTQNRISNAKTYVYSEKAIQDYVKNTSNRDYKHLTFFDITPIWLNMFEQYLLDNGKKISSVGIYLRPLRHLFNKAIQDKEIDLELYPFGKGKYQIPSSSKVKKALNRREMELLFNSCPLTPQQEKAKDFWFLSYNLNGMNIKDISNLKYANLSEEKISFVRAKTRRSTKENIKLIDVYYNEYILEMINKYGNEDKNPENYVFDILIKGISADEEHRRVKNFTKFINQNLKKLAKSINLPLSISTYWARHTFATLSIRKGASMEFMQESLGHKDMKTTINYFAGFDDDSKKEFANSLMDF